MAAIQVQQSINPMANLSPATAFSSTQSHSSIKHKNVQQQLANATDKTKSVKEAVNSKPTAENTGRWTKDEHDIFLQGLEKYGKEWKKIALMIETRTVVQIRTHAQKYFQKIAKSRELQGKEVPGDLTSTASNPRPIKQREKLGRTHQKRSNYSSTKKLRGSSISKTSQGTRASKQHVNELAATGFESYTKDVLDKTSSATSFKCTPAKRAFNENLDQVPLVPDGGSKKLKISTNKIDQAYIDNQNDIKWFLANSSGASRLPDSSPTSVSEFGLFRSFVGNNSDPSALFAFDSTQDEYNGSDSDECLLSPLPCDTDSVNEWFGDAAIVDGLNVVPPVSRTMDFQTEIEPLPELSICSLTDWVNTDGSTTLQRPRASSLDSIGCL